MKKIVLWALTGIMLLSLGACGSQEKTGTQSPSPSTGQTEEVTDGAKTDNGGDKTASNDQSGNESTAAGTNKWPESDLAKAVPAFTKGTFTNFMDIDSGFMVALEKVEAEDYNTYLVKIKETFTKGSSEENDGDMYTYVGSNEDSITVTLIYDENNKTINIMVEKASK